MATDVVVVGAGIAGLMCARRLHDAGVGVVVLDKARGVGGRMATRRITAGDSAAGGDDTGVQADHGAQYFTARHPVFTEMVARWANEAVVRRWGPGQPDSWIGVPSMTAPAKWLAEGLTVHTGTPVDAISTGGADRPGGVHAGFEVRGAGRQLWVAPSVVVTAPVPQALALFAAGDLDLGLTATRRLAAVTYDPCVAVMVGVAESGVGDAGWLAPDHPVVAWVADNEAKGISRVPVATVHCTTEASNRLIDLDDDAVVTEVSGALSELVGPSWMPDRAVAPVVRPQVMRWRYARVAVPDPQTCLVAEVGGAGRLVVAGDAFGGSRVEVAAVSGVAAADVVLSGLRTNAGGT